MYQCFALILACLFAVCMYVCLSMCLSVCMYVCMYVYMSVCLSLCLSVCLYVCNAYIYWITATKLRMSVVKWTLVTRMKALISKCIHFIVSYKFSIKPVNEITLTNENLHHQHNPFTSSIILLWNFGSVNGITTTNSKAIFWRVQMFHHTTIWIITHCGS